MEIDILNFEGKVSGKTELPEDWSLRGSDQRGTKVKANPHLIHEVVRAYMANQRKGTHSTLTRGNVQGGGKKPWKQKHTGRARAGTSRSPLWRGGGIIFGPHPRSYRIDLPQAKIRSALSQILIEKVQNNEVAISDKPQIESAKTKKMSEWIKKLSLPARSLLVLDQKDDKIFLASRNLKDFSVIEWRHLHPYQLLRAAKVVFTPEAWKSVGA